MSMEIRELKHMEVGELVQAWPTDLKGRRLAHLPRPRAARYKVIQAHASQQRIDHRRGRAGEAQPTATASCAPRVELPAGAG